MRTDSEQRVVVAGSIATDIIYNLPGVFENLMVLSRDKKISRSTLSESHKIRRGGTAANIAYTMGLLEMKPILFGSIGNEDLGYVQHMEKSGIDTRFLHRSNEEIALYTVFNDEINNQFAAFGGGAMYDSESLVLAAILQSLPTEPFVIISPHDPKQMLVQIQECKKYGLRMCFDIGQQSTNGTDELLAQGVEACEVLIANDSEMETIAKRLCVPIDKLTSAVPICITTLGKDGARIEGNTITSSFTVPAVPVESIADTTGAGDAFRAGFFYGYLNQKPVDESAIMGTLAASYALTNFGGQQHTFTRSEFTLQAKSLVDAYKSTVK